MKFFDFGVEFFFGYIKVPMARRQMITIICGEMKNFSTKSLYFSGKVGKHVKTALGQKIETVE
jgi:hypothetical protein